MNTSTYESRMQWFREARFGLFLHWGLYAIPARGEWVMNTERLSIDDYHSYFEEFNPRRFNARSWARMAKEAGMKYVVLTAKHHDGFCLFDSQLTDYKSTNTPFGRDIVREYIDAFREVGLKVGLYYSLLDWHHPDYPHYGDTHHPMRDNPAYKDKSHDFDNYLSYMHGQVEELCTRYGKIDILWFDFSYDDMTGEKWKATKLIEMVRANQPDIIVDNRLEASGGEYGSLASVTPSPYSGDFVSPEQIIPPGGIRNKAGEPMAWEACITMNNNWGYHRYDHDYKPASLLIRKLVECVSKGGNLLLNVGPDANGEFPEESVVILTEIGRWIRKNGDSIYGCGESGLEKPEYGHITKKGNTYYVHVMEGPIGPIPVKGIPADKIVNARLLASGAELPTTTIWTTHNYPDYTFLYYGPNELFTYPLPDPINTVIAITTKGDL